MFLIWIPSLSVAVIFICLIFEFDCNYKYFSQLKLDKDVKDIEKLCVIYFVTNYYFIIRLLLKKIFLRYGSFK